MRLSPLFAAAFPVLLLACTEQGEPVMPDPDPIGTPTSLEVASGNGQGARVTEPLPAPVVIRVLDQLGRPVEGAMVEFVAIAPRDGHFLDGTVFTDAEGLARGEWVLDTIAVTLHARARLIRGGEVIDDAHLYAEARPGPAVRIRVEGDTVKAIERTDSLFLWARGYDAYGNALDRDSLDVVWTSSDESIASVDGRNVIGISEGHVVVTATTAAGTGRLHLFVEGTTSIWYRMSRGHVLTGDGRLLFNAGDSIYEWNGSAWAGRPLTIDGSFSTFRQRVHVAPDGEFWAISSVACGEGCPGGNPPQAVFRSADGVHWDQSTDAFYTGSQVLQLAIGADGEPVLLRYELVTTESPYEFEPRVFRFDGLEWVSLHLPKVTPGDSVFQANAVAVADNGDVYVVGGLRHTESVFLDDPAVARFDGSQWHFHAYTGAGWSFSAVQAAAGSMYATLALEDAPSELVRIDGSAMHLVDTPLDDLGPYSSRKFAVSPTGEIAVSALWYDAAEWRHRSGAAFQTADGWEVWGAGEQPAVDDPYWHDGQVWLSTPENSPAMYLVRLDPEP